MKTGLEFGLQSSRGNNKWIQSVKNCALYIASATAFPIVTTSVKTGTHAIPSFIMIGGPYKLNGK